MFFEKLITYSVLLVIVILAGIGSKNKNLKQIELSQYIGFTYFIVYTLFIGDPSAEYFRTIQSLLILANFVLLKKEIKLHRELL